MELNYEKLRGAIEKIIIRNQGKDPITLSEKIADRLESLFEDADEGYGIPPVSIAREEQSAPPVTRSEPNERVATPPVPQGSRLILNPSDQEFQEARASLGGNLRESSPIALSKIGHPSQRRTVKVWTYEELTNQLHANTPDQITFVPDGCDDSVQVLAVRNVLTLQGTDTVRLEYASPQMGADSIQAGDAFGGGKATVALVASKTFTLFDDSIDILGAMRDIDVQLKGLYRPRGETMEPNSGPDPGPLRFSMSMGKEMPVMGANENMRLEQNWRSVADTKGAALTSVIRSNRTHGNKG